jgi:SOS-response transcriptional repressor LexA
MQYNKYKQAFFMQEVSIMLSDIERKVYQIIRNNIRLRNRPPSIKDLMVRTGRSQTGIMQVLESLKEKEHIEWSKGKSVEIRLLKMWERKMYWEYD